MHRTISLFVCAAAALAGGAAVAAGPPPGVAKIAVSADRLGVSATYHGPALDMGYSASTRRVTACLASFPGAYDPHTDRVRLPSGATFRCPL